MLSYYYFERYDDKIVVLSDFSEQDQSAIELLHTESPVVPLERFLCITSDCVKQMHVHGYKDTECRAFRYAMMLLYQFPDAHRLGYHPAIAAIWYKYIEQLL